MRRIKSVLKNPKMLLDLVYKKHLGLIYIDEKIKIDKIDYRKAKYAIEIRQLQDVNDVVAFYQEVGRNSITKSKVKKWQEQGHQCWGIYVNEELGGACWLFFNKVKLTPLSARTLSENNVINFNENIVYQGYVFIQSNYRGIGLYEKLNNELLTTLKNQHNNIKKILLITGASNGSVISTMQKNDSKLIGIIEVTRILGRVKRKEKYINKNYKVWW